MNENTFFEESAGNNSVLTHTYGSASLVSVPHTNTIVSLTSTLLSRLVLNLRGVGIRKEHDETRFSTRLSIARPEDIMLVSASTFSRSTASRSTDYSRSSTIGRSIPWSSTAAQSTLVGGSQDGHDIS